MEQNERQETVLNEEESEKFLNVLDNPPEPNEALKAAMQKYQGEQADQQAESHPDVGKVFCFHMCTGAAVVAQVAEVNEADAFYVILKPVELMVMPTKQGPVHDFVPWLSMFGALPPIQEMEIHSVDILYPREAPKQVADKYLEFVGEKKIVTPPQQKLIIPT